MNAPLNVADENSEDRKQFETKFLDSLSGVDIFKYNSNGGTDTGSTNICRESIINRTTQNTEDHNLKRYKSMRILHDCKGVVIFSNKKIIPSS